MNYYPPSLLHPQQQQQTELIGGGGGGKGTIITPQEYQRLQQESELVTARMREIEERIRDIESNRSNGQGGGGDGAAPSIAMGGGALLIGDEDSVEGGGDDLIDCIEDCSDEGSEVSEDSYYSDLVEEEDEDDEDTIGALLSSVSLLNNSKYQSDDDDEGEDEEEEDEDTVGPFLSPTSLAIQQLEGEEEEEKEEGESYVEIQGSRVSVSSLNLCESTSSLVSIDDGSAASTDGNSNNDTEEPSTTSRRKVRFDRHPVTNVSSSSPSSQASITYIDDSISHQSPDGNDQRGDHEKIVKYQRQSSNCGSVGSAGSFDSHVCNGKSCDSIASTTSSASNSSGDYHTLKTLLARPKKNRRRNVCNHSTISEENEFCSDSGDSVSVPTTKNALTMTQKKAASDPVEGDSVLSRHVEQTRNSLDRQGTQSSTTSASSISTLLEHAPLEVHLSELQKRRSKLLEMVEAQEQDRDDKKTKRSIEFSLFLMKDKLSQLQDLGVLGEEDEDELLKSGGTRRLLRKIKSEGANRSGGRKISPYKRSSTATG